MAEVLVGGAFGAAYSKIQELIIGAITKAVEFKPFLKKIDDTIKRIRPLIDEMNKSDPAHDPSQGSGKYVDLLNEGSDLIFLCSKVKSLDIIKRNKYATKLKKFDEELIRIFQLDMQVEQTYHLRQISAKQSDGIAVLRDVCAAPNPPRYIVGFDLPLEELKAMVLEENIEGPTITPDDSLPEVVVLSAMPGCGKTTLAQMLCHDKAIRDIYKHIFFVPVSKTANVKVIVERIYQDTSFKVPQLVDDYDAICQLGNLFKKLRTTHILLVLDDVWSENLVSKFMIEGIPRYKILVTTRLETPDDRRTTYKLKPLKFEDAYNLFCHSAKLPKPRTEHSPVSDILVKEMVNACKGFPLALDIVGRSLIGKSYCTWQDMLNKWSTGQSNVLDVNSELLARLTTILDALDEDRELAKVKECFLDLGSFPEDQRIPTATLLDMWVELYGFNEDGISTFATLFELANRNFVCFEPKRKNERDIGGFCKEEFVTLHDMLRDLAIHQCKQDLIQQRKRLIIEMNADKCSDNIQQYCFDAQLVSISTDDSFSSNTYNMELPKAKVLILNFQSKKYSFPKFVKNMDQLKVLIITNYGFPSAEVNDLSLIEHASGLTRIRLEHISISSLVSSAIQLTNLKKISLIMCEIGEALNDFAQMFPNVTEIEIDCCPNLIELPSALCTLVHLEKLSITSCNELSELPQQLGQLQNLIVLRLNSCTKLEELPESIGNLQALNFLDLSDCLNITRMPTRIGELRALKTLHMRGLICEELPSSVEELRGLTVIGDEQTVWLWQDYDNVEVIEVKEDPSLDWLHKSTPSGS